MICEIVAVGTEILLGDILNTNARFLSQQLSALGIDVFYQCVVGDNHDRLLKTLQTARGRSDIVIATGGLGPTDDDITKETAAEVIGKELFFHQESYQHMLSYFQQRVMTENNKKQAYLPKDSMVLPNHNGTAPGFLHDDGEKIMVVLPGPPFELEPMFIKYVAPYLMQKTGSVLKSKFLHVFGLGESRAASMLKDVIDKQTNPTIAPYAKMTEAVFRITAKGKDEQEAERLLAPCKEEICSILGDALYGEDDDTLESVTVGLLTKHHLTVSCAESCTGGLLASKITAVPGASAVLNESYVTYANEAKEALLGVPKETLLVFGAVSEQTARKMAEGVRKRAGADIGVGITGIAGPDGGTKEKPVGLVYVAVADERGTKVQKLQLNGSRNKNRELAACHALNMIRMSIIEREREYDCH